jgi:hypothetical protein
MKIIWMNKTNIFKNIQHYFQSFLFILLNNYIFC